MAVSHSVISACCGSTRKGFPLKCVLIVPLTMCCSMDSECPVNIGGRIRGYRRPKQEIRCNSAINLFLVWKEVTPSWVKVACVVRQKTAWLVTLSNTLVSLWPTDQSCCICSLMAGKNWGLVVVTLSISGENDRLTWKGSPKTMKLKSLRWTL